MKRRCKISFIFSNDGNPAGSPNWNAGFAMNQLVFLNDQIDLASSVRLDAMMLAAAGCSLHRESTVRILPLEDEESEEENDQTADQSAASKKDDDPSKKDEDPFKEK